MSSPLKTSLLLLLISLLASKLDAGLAGNAACSPDQRTLLLELKKRFVVPSTELVSWRPGSNCCNWEGVTCDEESGLITKLDINNRSIEGTISPSLFNLTSLRHLNLAFNDFNKSSISTGVELLVNLESLNLSYSRFSGQIPDGIASLRNLVTLDLSGFYFDGLKLENPNFETLIQNLSSLRELYLDGTNMSSAGNRWGAALARSTPKLQALSLSDCSLNGPIDSWLSQLQNLSVISLADNNHLNSAVPEFFGNFSSLSVLRLDSSGLRGTFPNDVFLLKNLTEVGLSANPMLSGSLPDFREDNRLSLMMLGGTNFSGHLPHSIGVLKSLKILNLRFCQFSGMLPYSIGKLTALFFVDLSSNNFQGEIPRSVFQLSKLKGLGLGSNNFTGLVELNWLSPFSELEYLDLSNIEISLQDTNDVHSVSFPLMEWLVLTSCNLTRVPNFLRYTPQIDYLDLSNNNIAGPIPYWIQSIGNNSLSHLNLSHNSFNSLEGPLPSFLTDSSASIDLSFNLIHGAIPLPPIYSRFVDYSNNYFSSHIPPNISAYLGNATSFSIANNKLTREIPSSICNANMLELLDLSGNKLSGLIPPCLLQGQFLAVLNLGDNDLQGIIPSNISRKCGLEALNLNGNHLEGQIPPSLANCNTLEVLDLGNNHLMDSMPFWLGNIHSLRVLVLRSNKLYGPVEPPTRTHASNYSFRALQILDISSNNFNGSIPKEFVMNLKGMMLKSVQNRPSWEVEEEDRVYYQYAATVTSKGLIMELTSTLKIFTSIDFSDNSFSGDIPEAIGELLSLNTLNFSNNTLTSMIPPSIGKLTNLESLDLSGNHLSGKIPQTLCDLTFLSYLNLSDNNLVGEIPLGNQLSTFSNSSFISNEGLCGSPLSKKCHDTEPTDTDAKSIPSESDHSQSIYVIGLALSTGLGYGMGIALVLVIQNVSCPHMRRLSSKFLFIISASLYSAASNILTKVKKPSQGVELQVATTNMHGDN